MNAPIPPAPRRTDLQPLAALPKMRKRMERHEEGNHPRFLTFSCPKRLRLFDDPWLAECFLTRLEEIHKERAFELFAWVVMPEHVHLLLRPAKSDTVAGILKSLKLSVSQSALARWKKSGDERILRSITVNDDDQPSPRVWQKGGGFDRNVRSMTAFTNEVLYIHQNPVERGLVAAADEWRWSSIRAWSSRHRREPFSGSPTIDPPPGDARHNWAQWRGFKKWP